MTAFRVSIGVPELIERVRWRVGRGLATVAWQDGTDVVVVHPDSLRARFLVGWFVCDLDVEAAAPIGRQALQVVYFLGSGDEGPGPSAASTIVFGSAEAAALADRWGSHVQRLVWDAVLDCLEAAIRHVAAGNANQQLTLSGFSCTERTLDVDVLVGAPS
jgi:hypothetical protein